jgi:deazaflavin-dependent oxidoreductase (nitroreductase family)
MTTTASPINAQASGADRAPQPTIGRYRRLIQSLGHHRWFAASVRGAGARIDRQLHRVSHGRAAITGPALFPVLLLTTTGRRTGRSRTTPVLYHRDGDDLIVCSENFGQRRPAAWPLNLLAHPHATVQLGAATGAYTARPANPAEVDHYWPQLLATWPAHATYHRRSGTRRMFVLTPATAGPTPS